MKLEGVPEIHVDMEGIQGVPSRSETGKVLNLRETRAARNLQPVCHLGR